MTTPQKTVHELRGDGIEPHVDSRGVPICTSECPRFLSDARTPCKQVESGDYCTPMIQRMAEWLSIASPPDKVEPTPLKLCPFCGADARCLDPGRGNYAVLIECLDCPAEIGGANDADAGKLWNRRAGEKQ